MNITPPYTILPKNCNQINGIGVDIVSIDRIEKLLNRFDTRFKRKVFTKAEQAYCKNCAACYAKRFAAKEAALKALGTGLAKGATWHSIEIKNNELGKPELYLHQKQKGHISLSDEPPYAIAFVIL